METKKTAVSHLILDKVEFKPKALHVPRSLFNAKSHSSP